MSTSASEGAASSDGADMQALLRKLQEQIATLTAQTATLTADRASDREQIATLTADRASDREQIATLTAEVQDVRASLDAGVAAVAEIRAALLSDQRLVLGEIAAAVMDDHLDLGTACVVHLPMLLQRNKVALVHERLAAGGIPAATLEGVAAAIGSNPLPEAPSVECMRAVLDAASRQLALWVRFTPPPASRAVVLLDLPAVGGSATVVMRETVDAFVTPVANPPPIVAPAAHGYSTRGSTTAASAEAVAERQRATEAAAADREAAKTTPMAARNFLRRGQVAIAMVVQDVDTACQQAMVIALALGLRNGNAGATLLATDLLTFAVLCEYVPGNDADGGGALHVATAEPAAGTRDGALATSTALFEDVGQADVIHDIVERASISPPGGFPAVLAAILRRHQEGICTAASRPARVVDDSDGKSHDGDDSGSDGSDSDDSGSDGADGDDSGSDGADGDDSGSDGADGDDSGSDGADGDDSGSDGSDGDGHAGGDSTTDGIENPVVAATAAAGVCAAAGSSRMGNSASTPPRAHFRPAGTFPLSPASSAGSHKDLAAADVSTLARSASVSPDSSASSSGTAVLTASGSPDSCATACAPLESMAQLGAAQISDEVATMLNTRVAKTVRRLFKRHDVRVAEEDVRLTMSAYVTRVVAAEPDAGDGDALSA